MTMTTISFRLVVGGKVHDLALVGDPADAMFALRVGRTVSEILLEHRDPNPEPPVKIPAPDGVYMTDVMRDDGEGFGERIDEDPR